ncbi:MAG: gamma-glutamyltransferase family protein [Gammaproteobacteria bacterium]|nr:gamma-glutamyltransferase family protein [Gammaproteobacteria bacterium]
MHFSTRSARGMVVAPHHLASEAGLAVLREGGNAIEAMIAAASTIAVVYPHMNSIGGDGFWLIHEPGKRPVAIDACGKSGAEVSPALYGKAGLKAIPARGPLAANTVAGTLSGWEHALTKSAEWGGSLPLSRLLEDAIEYANEGVPVTVSQHDNTVGKRAELEPIPGFSDAFMPTGVPAVGSRFRQPRLGQTLRQLATNGINDFYQGALARAVANDLQRAGSPITAADLRAHRAEWVEPLALKTSQGELFNFPPPTQGLASLMILGAYDRMVPSSADGFDYVHRLVEATKQAFMIRDREVTDPAFMTSNPNDFLQPKALDAMTDAVDHAQALPWPHPSAQGDTVWLGAVDSAGRAVSFIQSIYWEFGAGVVLEDTGVLWQNRGSSFQLSGDAKQALAPGRKPFHTLNPALCQFNDGRVLTYGTMGGEGQPQTQAMVYSRYAYHGMGIQESISAPRWLLGRTWGAESTTLKLESRFSPSLLEALRNAGHDVEVADDFDPVMGHAGAIVRYPDGTLEGGADPRSDGRAAGF